MTDERREKHNAYQREYYRTHPEQREKLKDYMREYMRDYYKSRPDQYEKHKEYMREYYATHPEFRAKKRAYQRARREKKKEEATMPKKKRVDSLLHYKLLPDMCKCHQCGEQFEKLSREWAYKLPNGRGGKWYYCTYKCWRKGMQAKPLRGAGYQGI